MTQKHKNCKNLREFTKASKSNMKDSEITYKIHSIIGGGYWILGAVAEMVWPAVCITWSTFDRANSYKLYFHFMELETLHTTRN